MTEQEAIKGLKNLFSEHELTLPCTDSLEILNVSIKALEKQIPKKPAFDNERSFIRLYHCPHCKGIVGIEIKHCHECGQKLDWHSIETRRGNENVEYYLEV